MTKNERFVFVIDNGEPTFYDLSKKGEIMNMTDTEEMLNELSTENRQLKQENEQLKESVWSWSKSYNRVYEDNDRIRNIIKDAYYNERTQLGKSVLKQLLEAIQ